MFHMHTRLYSRSNGNSSVAHSAYCSRSLSEDKRRGVTYDYSYKSDLVSSFILAPDGSPAWVYDRNALWNAVEKIETRRDAQLFRGITLAIPRSFDGKVSELVLRRFVLDKFVNHGMIVDSSIHGGGGVNPHAHLMITLRSVSKEGFGLKNRTWNSLNNVAKWRNGWADACNSQLDNMGLSHLHISPLSHAARGIKKNPQVHAGYCGVKKLLANEIDEFNAQIEIDRLRREIDDCQKEIDFLISWRRRRALTKPRVISIQIDNKVTLVDSQSIHQPELTDGFQQAGEISVSGIADRLHKVGRKLELPEPPKGHNMAP